jgi:hypothetical protein
MIPHQIDHMNPTSMKHVNICNNPTNSCVGLHVLLTHPNKNVPTDGNIMLRIRMRIDSPLGRLGISDCHLSNITNI